MEETKSEENFAESGTSDLQWSRATQWISRTLSVVIFMIAPGILGSMLDKKFETKLLAPIGFAIGLVLGTVGLLVLAKRFTPPSGGKPLTWEGEKHLETGQGDGVTTHDPE